MPVRALARDLGVAVRLGVRGLGRRTARGSRTADPDAWRAALERWRAGLPAGSVASHRFVSVPARRPPWLDTGMMLGTGDQLTWLATGRVHLSRLLDIWVEPSFQLWGRIAPGPVFRGTRDSHTFTATQAGALELASYFPGEWATREGELGHGAADYEGVSGGLEVLLLRWAPGVDVERTLAASVEAPAIIVGEVERLRSAPGTPAGWDYLWSLGPGEIYHAATSPTGTPSIRCETHGDVGILRRPVDVPLRPGTRLGWRWRVDRLPADLREDSLPSHDYLSIAVEFDDGRDLTYYWSAALPVGTAYRCPLPTWKDKETHLVVRSGPTGLGCWLDESRDLHADYHRFVGGSARSVVRVWLIANSLFQRGRGQCEYAGIGIDSPGAGRITVL
jgi:hypothetical protein